MKNIEFLFACIFILCACEKEDIIDYPITLYASELSQVSDIRLFINKNEIHDQDVIRTFIGNSRFFQLPTSIEIQSSNESIRFLSSDSAIFEPELFPGFSVNKKSNQFLFYSPRMVVNHFDGIVHPLLKYSDELTPFFSYSDFSFSDFSYITREMRVGYGSYRNLEISFLSYMQSRDRGSYRDFVSGKIMNEFNEEAINNLQLRDTLAIQEYRVRYIAK